MVLTGGGLLRNLSRRRIPGGGVKEPPVEFVPGSACLAERGYRTAVLKGKSLSTVIVALTTALSDLLSGNLVSVLLGISLSHIRTG
jgi:hypothetical protein